MAAKRQSIPIRTNSEAMRLRGLQRAYIPIVLSACALQPQPCVMHSTPPPQQKSLTRIFAAGAKEQYKLTATIRIETRGISTEKIGEKTYATPYTHEASGQLSWRTIRKITSVQQDGTSDIAESLDQFHANCDGNAQSPDFRQDLQKSIHETCANWQTLSQMNYQEEKFGAIRGLALPTNIRIEDSSPLLDYWLRRAFRPSVILPKGPLNFGYQSAHKIANQSGDPASPEGEELVEWLEGPADPPAAILHVSQNLSWLDSPRPKNITTVQGSPNRRQTFYADSLNTISLVDGSILKATRSATQETKEVLEPVPGLPDPPTFSYKLTITVTIQSLP